MAACARRAELKQRLANPGPQPEPGTTIPGSWEAIPTDPPALALYLHSGRGSDLANAIEFIEDHIEESDPAERNFAIESEWDAAQSEALRLCTSWLPEIRALAALLCRRGGQLSEGEIRSFWEDARWQWARRQAAETIERLRQKKGQVRAVIAPPDSEL